MQKNMARRKQATSAMNGKGKALSPGRSNGSGSPFALMNFGRHRRSSPQSADDDDDDGMYDDSDPLNNSLIPPVSYDELEQARKRNIKYQSQNQANAAQASAGSPTPLVSILSSQQRRLSHPGNHHHHTSSFDASQATGTPSPQPILYSTLRKSVPLYSKYFDANWDVLNGTGVSGDGTMETEIKQNEALAPASATGSSSTAAAANSIYNVPKSSSINHSLYTLTPLVPIMNQPQHHHQHLHHQHAHQLPHYYQHHPMGNGNGSTGNGSLYGTTTATSTLPRSMFPSLNRNSYLHGQTQAQIPLNSVSHSIQQQQLAQQVHQLPYSSVDNMLHSMGTLETNLDNPVPSLQHCYTLSATNHHQPHRFPQIPATTSTTPAMATHSPAGSNPINAQCSSTSIMIPSMEGVEYDVTGTVKKRRDATPPTSTTSSSKTGPLLVTTATPPLPPPDDTLQPSPSTSSSSSTTSTFNSTIVTPTYPAASHQQPQILNAQSIASSTTTAATSAVTPTQMANMQPSFNFYM